MQITYTRADEGTGFYAHIRSPKRDLVVLVRDQSRDALMDAAAGMRLNASILLRRADLIDEAVATLPPTEKHA
ncbi:TPA: hypothetical protein QDB28_004064 [Burkholderia vietnamiensis]|nr:hypothetical protein [Burkholderia vietnamiensis]